MQGELPIILTILGSIGAAVAWLDIRLSRRMDRTEIHWEKRREEDQNHWEKLRKEDQVRWQWLFRRTDNKLDKILGRN